jgi:hypothetical protein
MVTRYLAAFVAALFVLVFSHVAYGTQFLSLHALDLMLYAVASVIFTMNAEKAGEEKMHYGERQLIGKIVLIAAVFFDMYYVLHFSIPPIVIVGVICYLYSTYYAHTLYNMVSRWSQRIKDAVEESKTFDNMVSANRQDQKILDRLSELNAVRHRDSMAIDLLLDYSALLFYGAHVLFMFVVSIL